MSNATHPALTVDSATAHGLAAELHRGAGQIRLHITAKRAGEILRFLAACGLDCTKDQGEAYCQWHVRDQAGSYLGAVITAPSIPDFAFFSCAA